MICQICGNLDALEKSVKIYKEFCAAGLNYFLAERTFIEGTY